MESNKNLKKVSWDTIQSMCKTLSAQVIAYKAIKFDCILCMGRGSMVPSRLLSEYLDIKDVAYLDIGNLYSGTEIKNQHTQKAGVLHRNFSNNNVLMVDECMTTGTTFQNSRLALTNHIDKKPRELGFACLFVNKSIRSKPSFFCEEYDANDTWIVFPWEL